MNRRRTVSTATLVGIAVLALPPALSAQQNFRISGGIDLATFFGGGAEGVERKSALGFGGSFRLFEIGPAEIVAEGYYRQKGAKNIEELNEQVIAGEPAEIGLDYVEVPVLLRFRLPALGNRVFPYLQGGPAFAWRIECSVTIPAGGGSTQENCDDLTGGNLEETLKQYEQGLAFGAGIDIPVANLGAVNIDARLTRGLSRINEGAEGGLEVKNQVFSVMLGYSFAPPTSYGGGIGR